MYNSNDYFNFVSFCKITHFMTGPMGKNFPCLPIFGRFPKNFIPVWASSKTSLDGQQSHAAFLRNVVLIPAGIIQQAFNKIWSGIAEMNEPDSL